MKIIEGEIEANIIENIIKNIPSIKEIYRDDFTILIHGMGCKTRSYYEMIPHTKNVNLLWTGWSSRKWWTYLLRFIPGEAGLVEIKDRKKSAELFLEIDEQSMSGLYFIPKVKLIEIVEDVK